MSGVVNLPGMGGVMPCALWSPPENCRQGSQVWCAVTASESEGVLYFVPACDSMYRHVY